MPARAPLVVLLALLLVPLPAGEAASGNLLANPGFETGDASGRPTSWSFYTVPGLHVARSALPPAHEGTYSLALAGRPMGDGTRLVYAVGTPVDIAGGSAFTFVAYVRDPLESLGAMIVFTRNGIPVGTPLFVGPTLAPDWTTISRTGVSPATATKAVVYLTVRPGAVAAQIDDLAFVDNTLFAESWESGLDAWTTTGTGAAIDCAVGSPGCSLRLAPGVDAAATVARSDVDIPISSAIVSSVDLMATSVSDGPAFAYRVDLAGGSFVRLNAAGGTGADVMLETSSGASAKVFTWAPNTWYRVTVTLDPATNTVRAEARRAFDDAFQGSTSAFALPSGGAIDGLHVSAVARNAATGAAYLDSIRLRPK